MICIHKNEETPAKQAGAEAESEKGRLMGATVDCYITSPKSQNYLADDEKSLLAGVVLAAPAFFYYC